ncbi:MAG TPA: hypothetical protein VNN79_00990 [Actinomycetota bacterium]|nr:hypothetical protein [Actinomycetota bacterium]
MSTPPEHRPTEPQPVVSTSTPPPAAAEPPMGRSRAPRAYDPVARIAQVVIAVVLVILFLLIIGGYKFHVTVDKQKKEHTPKVTHSPNP